ncbi:MAG TPA: FKBP-type peptidyl-prolyl cis-trans isomerase [Labilithrix sp.]
MRFALALLVSCAACGGASQPELRPTTAKNAQSDDPWLIGPRCAEGAAGEPRVEVLAQGTGEPATVGETVRVDYVAKLADGTKLHDTHSVGEPSEIIIGSTKTICGFEKALVGMRPGEQRRVTVPAALAFGEAGRTPDVPPNADLVFVVDLYLPADATPEQRSRPTNPAGGRGGGGRRR